MDWALFGVFLAAGLLVAAAPGPTVLQIFAQSMSGDPRRPASLIAGAVLANALMVAATITGVGAVIVASQTAFTILRWVGSAYLVYLGIHYWRMRADPMTVSMPTRARPYRLLFIQAALTSLTNPKGLVFYIAFLPQFVSPAADPVWQLAVLGVAYIGLCLIADIGYALAGLALANLSLSRRAVMLKNRLAGSVLIGAALSLLRVERG